MSAWKSDYDSRRSDRSSISVWLDGHPDCLGQYAACNESTVDAPILKRKRRLITQQAQSHLDKRRRLTETSVNIMTTPKRGRKPKGDVLASAPDLREMRPQRTDLDPDKTPVPTKKSRSVPYVDGSSDPPPVFKLSETEPSAPFIQYTSSPSRSESPNSAASSRRSRPGSPGKRISDYQLSDTIIERQPIDENEVPSEVKNLVRDWNKISKARKVIPRVVQRELEEMGEEVDSVDLMDDEEAAQYTSFTSTEDAPRYLRKGFLSHDDFFVHVWELCEVARECWRKNCAEPAWNGEVHCRLLRLALRGYWQSKGVWYEDVTTAQVSDRSLLPAVEGIKMQSKLVDYAITMGSSPGFIDRVTAKLNKPPRRGNPQELTINQTSAEYVRFNPIAVSIETKRGAINEDQSNVQLAAWTAAHFAKLELLSSGKLKKLPVLPLLVVQGHIWKMLLAVKSPALEQDPRSKARITFLGDILLGQTSTITGIYQVLAGIRRLAKWTDEQYRPWYEEEILANLVV